MKKAIPILLMIIILGGFSYYVITSNNNENLDSEFYTDQKYLDMAESPGELSIFIAEVKQNPSSVINAYMQLRKMIYSGKYDKTERESLILMQRYFFHEELLEKNPKATHILATETEIEKWAEIEFALIGYDSLPPEYYPNDIIPEQYTVKDVAIINVVYYTNDVESEEYSDTDIYTEYILVENLQDQWEIFGWQRTGKFEIID